MLDHATTGWLPSVHPCSTNRRYACPGMVQGRCARADAHGVLHLGEREAAPCGGHPYSSS
jgi:hypothetical protein